MRPEKANIHQELLKQLQERPYLIVADYTGVKVEEFSDLRKRLATAGGRCQVVKNSFICRAVKEAGFPDLSAQLVGQTAIITGAKDISAAAKVLKKFAEEKKKFTLRGGVLDNAFLTDKQLDGIADLPSKEVLQAQLLGLLLAPATKLVRTLNEPASMIARVLQAKASQAA